MLEQSKLVILVYCRYWIKKALTLPHPLPVAAFDFHCPVFSRASLKMALRENGGHILKRAKKVPTTVVFIHSDELVKLCDNLPKVPNRVSEFCHFIRVILHIFRRDVFPLPTSFASIHRSIFDLHVFCRRR